MPYLVILGFAALFTFVVEGNSGNFRGPFDRDRPQVSRSTPGPLIGTSIPLALGAAGYIWMRRRAGRK